MPLIPIDKTATLKQFLLHLGSGPQTTAFESSNVRKAIVIGFSFLVTACETPMMWQGPPGSTDQQLAQARYRCVQDVYDWKMRMSPQLQKQTDPYFMAASVGMMNQRAKEMFNMCMEANGYRQITNAETVPTPAQSAPIQRANSSDWILQCKSNRDCASNESCRSKTGGGTECRAGSDSTVIMECTTNADCRNGLSCRSKPGGETQCR